MKAICIDASNKPSKVSESEWLIEGQIYTITRVVRMGLQNNKFGVLLKEVKLSSESFPYELYDADRFIIIDELLKSEQEETILEKEVELNII
jgi:hypothetical protein